MLLELYMEIKQIWLVSQRSILLSIRICMYYIHSAVDVRLLDLTPILI